VTSNFLVKYKGVTMTAENVTALNEQNVDETIQREIGKVFGVNFNFKSDHLFSSPYGDKYGVSIEGSSALVGYLQYCVLSSMANEPLMTFAEVLKVISTGISDRCYERINAQRARDVTQGNEFTSISFDGGEFGRYYESAFAELMAPLQAKPNS